MTNVFVTVNQEKENELFLHNVKKPSLLSYDCDHVEYEVYGTGEKNKYAFKYEPDFSAQKNIIRLSYDNVPVGGTPLHLTPQLPEYSVNEKNNMITMSNVRNPKQIELVADSKMNYEVYEDLKDRKTFHIQYENPEDLRRNITLKYNNRVVNKSPIVVGKNNPVVPPGKLIASSKSINRSFPSGNTLVHSHSAPAKEEEILTKSHIGMQHPEYGTLIDSSVEPKTYAPTVQAHTELQDVERSAVEKEKSSRMFPLDRSGDSANSSVLPEIRDEELETLSSADIGRSHSKYGELVHVHNAPKKIPEVKDSVREIKLSPASSIGQRISTNSAGQYELTI